VAEAIAVWFLRRRRFWALGTLLATLLVGVWVLQRHLALLDLPYHSENVDFAIVCRKLLEAGDPEEAEWSARNFAKERARQVRPRANLVEVLYCAGKKDDARREFALLRELAGTADLDSPPLARLAPAAREFGFPADWRLPQKIEQSLAGRRPLASSGPLLWRPSPAPDWRLKDSEGRDHSLAEFHGKPVVLIFFLGGECLHCQKQVESFAAKASDFGRAGLTVIAVSVDDETGIKKCLYRYKPATFPFLMLADPRLTVFQSYGAFDDFEQIALHGTFLIDGEGLVRFSDVGAEPFMDAGFVIGEAQRLLSRPLPPVEVGSRVITTKQ
jgi:peroxiredoxin